MFHRVIGPALRDPRYLPARAVQAGWQLWSRLRARSQPQAGGEVLCRALGRYPMVVSEADVGLAPFLIRSGTWELWITRFIRARLKPGMTALDAGANLGYFSVVMADAVGPGGRLFAAEPIPATRSLLERNLALNGVADRATVLAAALGEAPGAVRLMIPDGEPKNAIVQPEGVDYSFGRPHRVVEAPITTVDALDLPRLDFAKIDVEGHELALWRGMQATLDRSPDIQVVIEVNGARGQAAELLDALAARFPLRAIDVVGNLRPITAAEILSHSEDVMLYLSAAA